MGPGEGNRRSNSGEEDAPHVSDRRSVQLTKECAEQQGNAAKRQRQETDKERRGRGGRLMKIVVIVSLYIYTVLFPKD